VRDKAKYKRRRDDSPKRRRNSVLDLVNDFTEQRFKDLPVVLEEIEYDVKDFERDFIKDFNALRAAVLANDVNAVKAMGFESFCRQYKNCLVQRIHDNENTPLYYALWHDKADEHLNIDMLRMLMSIPSEYEYKIYIRTFKPNISIKAKYQTTTGLIHVAGLKDMVIDNDEKVYSVSYDVNSQGQILNYLKEPRPDVKIPKYGEGCIIS